MKFRLTNFLPLILITFLLFFRYLSTRPNYQNGDFIRITSRVYTEPIVYERQQYIKLQGLKVYLPKYPEISYGDRIIIQGVVGGNRLNNAELLEIKTNNKNLLFNLRLKLISFYKSSLPEPYSSLVAGITLGSKNMPEDFWDKLKSTGTAHIVVASGSNVAMFSSFLILVLTRFLNRKVAVFMTGAGIITYVVLSGFDAPIIRASIMGAIVMFGQSMGRITNTIRILLYTGALMLIIKPDYITDLGFILSFVATLSLILFQKRIDEKLKRLPNILRDGLSTSIAAQIGAAPIIFVTFGQFNILSPVINALILWTIPYIMGLGMIAGVIGLFIPLIGRMILFVIFPLLYYFVQVISIFD